MVGSPLLTLEEGRLDFFQESFEGIAGLKLKICSANPKQP